MEGKKTAAAMIGFAGTAFVVQTAATAGGTMEGHAAEDLRMQRLAARAAVERSGASVAFKPESSAKWTDIVCKGGRTAVRIEHDTLHGVTGEMIKWWFEHLGCYTTWDGIGFDGPEVSLYHLWHHRDHVAVVSAGDAPDGTQNRGFLPGADSMLEERFNEVHFHVENRMRTVVLTDRELTFDVIVGGVPVGRLRHLYEPEAGGSSFYAETVIGAEGGFGAALFNNAAGRVAYSQADAEHWIRHNIEETGRTEDVLPALWEHRDKVYFKH